MKNSKLPLQYFAVISAVGGSRGAVTPSTHREEWRAAHLESSIASAKAIAREYGLRNEDVAGVVFMAWSEREGCITFTAEAVPTAWVMEGWNKDADTPLIASTGGSVPLVCYFSKKYFKGERPANPLWREEGSIWATIRSHLTKGGEK